MRETERAGGSGGGGTERTGCGGVARTGMAARPVGAQAELDIEARLQTAREQFQQRLALIKRDLLLGQAELSSQEAPPAGPVGDPWPGDAHPSRVIDSSSFQAGGGDDELTAQVRAWPHLRGCAPERFGRRQRRVAHSRPVGLSAGRTSSWVFGGLLRRAVPTEGEQRRCGR